MRRQRFPRPLPTPRSEKRQRKLVGELTAWTFGAYAAFAFSSAAAGNPLADAVIAGSYVRIALFLGCFVVAYLVVGGTLCAAFVDKLRHWPPPDPDLRFNGASFVRGWLWSAPRILVELAATWHVHV